MEYGNLSPGKFLSRPNRFLAWVEIDGTAVCCHVKNTGRCRELLYPGVTVWCQHHDDPRRKTAWSLLAVEKQGNMINIDSQAPNRLAFDYVKQGGLGFVPALVQAEKTYGSSRFDLYYETEGRRGFVEVKGVTLEEQGIACFPDAPTQRGYKHLTHLCHAVTAGYEAWVLFVLQMSGMQCLRPNWRTDPQFSEALCHAATCGVQIRAVECHVWPSGLEIQRPVPVDLNRKEEIE